MQWNVKHFNKLTTLEYHNILHLRTKIFVVEQDCPYQEVDFKDPKCYHVFGIKNSEIIAVTRIIPSGISCPEISIGRVALSKVHRGTGIADQLMDNSIHFIETNLGEQPIRISAQQYLLKYYDKHGFVPQGKMYLEDGIPHVEMLRNA